VITFLFWRKGDLIHFCLLPFHALDFPFMISYQQQFSLDAERHGSSIEVLLVFPKKSEKFK